MRVAHHMGKNLLVLAIFAAAWLCCPWASVPSSPEPSSAKVKPPRRHIVLGSAATLGTLAPGKASAADRSRIDGYAFQLSEAEWKQRLNRLEYFVMREGGTERPGTSTLLKEKRPGTFKCIGCGTPLFASTEKFDSGTGWPSFAARLAGVEEEAANPAMRWLGQELRCSTCGSHLGDVFDDGMFFPGTRASQTGRRYCIDGCALEFYPEDGSEPRRGD
mmetsp:Transcript_33115/g.75487  ORF Transcript_33115/g.75487 Transcript_33115/m.75487 type:complete len:218 (+) Transcript_33115:68-721(+)